MSGGIFIFGNLKNTVGSPVRTRGLTTEEAERSLRENGDNTLKRKPGKSFWGRFVSNFGDPVIKILIGTLAVNLLLSFRRADWIETAGIAVSVLLATFISTISEHGSENAFRRLSESSRRTLCRVRRDGGVKEIPIEKVAVGDTVLLNAGDPIPADGFIVSGSVTVDQSALTGESREISKSAGAGRLDPSSPFALFRGCNLLTGNCEMQVAKVGNGTFIGGISEDVHADTRESPLRIRLTQLASEISKMGYIGAALVAIVYIINALILNSGFDSAAILSKIADFPLLLDILIHALMIGLTVVVMAVPEGLPVMVAVVLSSNVKRMIKSNVLVRKAVGIEAAGSMNILFTDKTGTLTEGKMSVAEICLPDGTCFDSLSVFSRHSKDAFGLYVRSCLLNSESVRGVGADGKITSLGGNSTDRALMNSIIPFSESDIYCDISKRIEFSSARKFSAVSVQNRVYVKGSPELICGLCKNASPQNRLLQTDGRRRVSIAYADFGSSGEADGFVARLKNGISGQLTLICTVILEDRIRREAASTVKRMQKAGIHIVMITGDSAETASYICSKCGIINSQNNIITDSEGLSKMTDAQVTEILPRLAAVARALPSDKSRLVRIAEEAQLVVGMTGDGINDAPALKLADVGFAMGDGTQVAKDAGDIIILDDNIGSISKAVIYGRNAFKSIRKFITLQLMMNFCAVGISMICPFLGIDTPVTVVQMLWINIVMDTLGGLAFAGEPANENLLDEPPKKRSQRILNRYMANQIIINGSFTVALCIFFLKSQKIAGVFRPAEDNIYLMTAFFAMFIFSSVFNCFNARTDRLRLLADIDGNRGFVFIMTLVLLIQIIFVYVGGQVLRAAPLTLAELGFTALISLSVFPADLLRKVIWRMRGKKGGY